MIEPNSSQANAVTPAVLVQDLEALRDAAVRLSLAMADYQFYVESTQRPDVAREACAALARVKTLLLK